MISTNQELKIISKGALEIIHLEEIEKKLIKKRKEGRPLILKLGLDPTAPDIHLGHCVVLRKIKQMQDLGHHAVIIIGDFTGKIGDPTGKNKTRRQLSEKEVLENAKTYESQIFRVLDKEKTTIRFNSEWLNKLNFSDVIKLASKTTVARMLERDDFKKRYHANESIGIHEFFYPLMQAYDSVALKADIEIGGMDQRFNILMGRTIQKDYGLESQAAIFMPILEGTDGKDKMSKSLGNYIGINENPKEIFGKVMSIPDSLILTYFSLATDIHPDKLENIKTSLDNGIVNPRDIKMELASTIVSLYHGIDASIDAKNNFVNLFQKNKLPKEIPSITITEFIKHDGTIDLPSLMVNIKFTGSKSEAKRLIKGGGVKIDGKKINLFDEIVITNSVILQSGKRNFIRINP